jgi:hypothetical protein
MRIFGLPITWIVAAASILGWIACSSDKTSNTAVGAVGPDNGSAGTTGSMQGAGGGSSGMMEGSGGGAVTTTTGGGSASTGAGGASSAGGNGGAGGSTTGAGGGGVGGMAGFEPGDTMPWRALNVTAPPGQHLHGNAGVDTRAKSIGKLAVDVGVNQGGYSTWLGKRGFHVFGAACGACPAPNLAAGRDAVGNCRLDEFKTTSAQVKAGLAMLQQQYPQEDWGYFLNQDGSVRWSDVAITGVSHGATTAAVAGRIAVRMYRVVSRSGPRDNTCGVGAQTTPFDPAMPPWKANCPDSDVASWLDMPSITPINRFYGLTGTTDVEYGDIMFNMERTKYPGQPVQWNVMNPNLNGTNRFYSTEGGHLDWLLAANVPINTDEVLNIAFGVPPENQHPIF